MELEGVIERITYQNEENGYTVARFKTGTEVLRLSVILAMSGTVKVYV